MSWMNMTMLTIIGLIAGIRVFGSKGIGGFYNFLLVKNEYRGIGKVYRDGGKPYGMWAAQLALSQNISVPWIMCQLYDLILFDLHYKLVRFKVHTRLLKDFWISMVQTGFSILL